MRGTMVMVMSAVVAGTMAAQAPQVTTEDLEGVRNFKRLETTIACAGATSSDALPALKKMGFASVVNLRQASEAGNDVVLRVGYQMLKTQVGQRTPLGGK